ncbi:MAG: HEAT repeat domain-containing protein [Acidimicrobiia bacterium]|nr:HEAT repeat domain-containing protein [Acidimicrobiia bacterium]
MIEEELSEDQLSRGVVDASAVLSALGAAWTTFALYPNPKDQPAFDRAVADLARFSDGGPVIDVGAGIFTFRGNQLPVSRDGLDRLATQFFVHDVEAFRFVSAPDANDLLGLFEVVADENVNAEAAVADLLAEAGVESVVVWARGLLGSYGDTKEDGYEEQWGEGRSVRRSRIAEIAELGVDAEFMVSSLKELCGTDSDLLAKHFVDAFVELHTPTPEDSIVDDLSDALMPYLAEDLPPSPLTTFMDAFRLLEGDDRIRVFERFLDSVDDATHRLFVDQFGGLELGDVADDLDGDYTDALLGYVRESLDSPEGTFDDLLPPLQSSEDIGRLRRDASERISQVLQDRAQEFDPGADGYASVRQELTRPFPDTAEIDVMRRLFVFERRQHRLRRVVRVWTGRVAEAMRSGDYKKAWQVVMAIQDDPPYAADDRHIVDEALGQLIDDDLLESLWDSKERADRSDLPDLVAALGTGAVDKLIEELATEENSGRRKVLVELLGGLAARSVMPIANRLGDKRWYVVRNLATVLGRSANPGAAKPLRALTEHTDHRVRVEAMRALVPLDPEASFEVLVEMLHDSNHRVRQTALTYLRTGQRPVGPLAAAIDSGQLEPEVGRAVVHVIARQKDAGADEALKRLAGKKVAMRGVDRTVRQAAKEALKGLG